jgi:sec-independent protein translocase protein TatC
MTESQLIFAISLMIALIALPLVVVGLVRLLVPLRDDPQEPEPQHGVSSEPMTLRDYWEGAVPHLIELRNRLIKSAIGVGIGTAVGFYVVNSPSLLGDTLPNILIDQFVPQGINLQFIGTAEGFVTYMGVALLIGFAIAIPIVVYQIIAFFSPGLTAREKRVVFTALPFVSELFVAGVIFGWAFTIPAATRFLFSYGVGPRIEARPSFENFFSTVTTLLLWNGLVFELPAVVYLLARIGIVSAQQLAATRRYAIVIIVIVAAIITPTGDPYNLLLLAVPMYLLYELGILLARFVPRRGPPESGAPA